MTSIVFDRAAGFYDRTRSLGPEQAEALTRALISLGGLDDGARALEVGVGTGRIAVPLMQRQFPLVGIDLSRPMLAVAQSKWPQARLVQGDALRLPLPDGCFDCVLMAHVLHLIASWDEALYEVKRVLSPSGRLLIVRRLTDENHPLTRLLQRYAAASVALGVPNSRIGARDQQSLEAFWHDQGWRHETTEVMAWTEDELPQAWLDGLRQRLWSSTWQIDDRTLDTLVSELSSWGASEFGDLNLPAPYDHHLLVDVVIPYS